MVGRERAGWNFPVSARRRIRSRRGPVMCSDAFDSLPGLLIPEDRLPRSEAHPFPRPQEYGPER